jgi:hypothetical protein
MLALMILSFVKVLWPECPEEDATMCIWDASVQGNGIGQSFLSLWDGFYVKIGF